MKGVLGDIATLQVGFPFKSADFVPEGVRLLRGDNIGQGFLRWDQAARWKHAEPSEYLLRPDDVVIAMDRPWIGAGLKFARVRPADLPALLVQRVAVLRAKPGTHQRFLESAIRDSRFAAYIQSVQTGTAVPHISGEQILNYRLALRPFGEQEAIAEVLGALDDKIAANSRLVASAEGLSSARFSSLARDVLAPLSQVAEFVNGRNFTKDASGTGRVVIRIAELNSGLGGSTVYADLDAPANNVAGPGSLLFAWSGSLTVKRWFLGEGLVNQHIFKVLPREHYPMWLVHQLLLEGLDAFRAIAADKATTMGHIQRGHLDVAVRVPDPATIEANHDVMQGLWDRSLAAEVESVKLAELRDALLPLLMSGQVRVRDAERDVERVL